MATGPAVLVLWDVDHTLIDNGGVSKANYALAFRLLMGRSPTAPARTGGRTDAEILEDLLRDNGVDPGTVAAARRYRALAEAGRRNRRLLRSKGHALPGAVATLRRLRREPGVLQSVLTGNIRENARVKLAAFGLHRLLDLEIGAYGADSRVRGDLVAVAQAKAAARRRFDPAVGATILVGDTPRDVQAGLDGGAHVIAVATGGVPAADLTAAGAHVVLADLTDPQDTVVAVRRLQARGRPPGPVQRPDTAVS